MKKFRIVLRGLSRHFLINADGYEPKNSGADRIIRFHTAESPKVADFTSSDVVAIMEITKTNSEPEA